MTDADLTARSEFAVDAVATVDAGAHAPGDLWNELATSDGFERALTDAVREILADVPHYDQTSTLYDQGVTAGDGGYARLVTGLERPPESPVYERAVSLTAQFGSGEVTPLGTRLPLDEIETGPLAAFAIADYTPTIAVRLGRDFQDRRRDQREAVCNLLCQLGEECHVVDDPAKARTKPSDGSNYLNIRYIGLTQVQQKLKDKRRKEPHTTTSFLTWPVGTRRGSRMCCFFGNRNKRLASGSGYADCRVPLAGRS